MVLLPPSFSSCGKLETEIFRFCRSLDINTGCGGGDLHQVGCRGDTYAMTIDSSFQYVHRFSMVYRVCVLVPLLLGP
jgi:hypothetical protein